MNPNSTQSPFIVPAAIMGACLILASAVGAIAFYKSRTLDNTLSVTGSAQTAVAADSVKWTFNISRRVTEGGIGDGYTRVARDLVTAKQFLKDHNVTDEEITVRPVFVEQIWKSDTSQGPSEFTLRQEIIVQSSDVDKITRLAGATEELAHKDVFVAAMAPEYYYSKIAELRVSLLADAIKDAKARAAQIAKASGSSVGALKAASSGVVQVLAPNSIEVSDYGQYDTSSIQKQVMVTVRATFFVR